MSGSTTTRPVPLTTIVPVSLGPLMLPPWSRGRHRSRDGCDADARRIAAARPRCHGAAPTVAGCAQSPRPPIFGPTSPRG